MNVIIVELTLKRRFIHMIETICKQIMLILNAHEFLCGIVESTAS